MTAHKAQLDTTAPLTEQLQVGLS